jgi:hypothetical protein
MELYSRARNSCVPENIWSTRGSTGIFAIGEKLGMVDGAITVCIILSGQVNIQTIEHSSVYIHKFWVCMGNIGGI